MQVSKRFLALLEQQLAQFTDRPDLQELVVYLALPGENGKPNLVPIGQWPALTALPKAAADAERNTPAPLGETQRWLALRDGSLLLGAMRVEASCCVAGSRAIPVPAIWWINCWLNRAR